MISYENAVRYTFDNILLFKFSIIIDIQAVKVLCDTILLYRPLDKW